MFKAFPLIVTSIPKSPLGLITSRTHTHGNTHGNPYTHDNLECSLHSQLLSSLQFMTGRDSSDAKSAQSIALLALAAFSTSYNLPVYLHYNTTFRRAYLRMLRCQSEPGGDGQAVTTRTRRTMATTTGTGIRKDGVAGVAVSEDRSPQKTLGRDSKCGKDTEPSTSRATWARSNTKQTDSPDEQRY